MGEFLWRVTHLPLLGFCEYRRRRLQLHTVAPGCSISIHTGRCFTQLRAATNACSDMMVCYGARKLRGPVREAVTFKVSQVSTGAASAFHANSSWRS